MTPKKSVYIIGAGPAGLAAAFELSRKREFNVNVIEKRSVVGGISRTESYQGYLFDIGGHRFYTKSAEVDRIWRETLGDEFLRVRRSSRIYYKKKFFNYPLQLTNTIRNLGITESILICFSYLKSCLLPELPESTFEQWVSNRFGKRLFRMFFKDYTEKVWGIPCNMIQAEWAAQRIQGLSFLSAIKSAVLGINSTKSLIEEFSYPRLGPGMMWQAFQKEIVHQGGCVQLGSAVTSLQHENNRITAVVYKTGSDNTIRKDVDTIISSAPLSSLVHFFSPPPPKHVLKAANKLSYRSFIIVILIVKKQRVFSDQWLYIHSPEIIAGRIQNYKNWSQSMVPDKNTTSLGVEYFCDENDFLWNQTDEQLVANASREIEQLGFIKTEEIIDSFVVRQSKAYPVYDRQYKQNIGVIREYLMSFTNLQTVGRAGMHRYNNMDHSMITGIQAAKNLTGGGYNVWEVNEDREHLEAIDNKSMKTKKNPIVIRKYRNTIVAVLSVSICLYVMLTLYGL